MASRGGQSSISVDAYFNADPFVQGTRTATAAAEQAEKKIGVSVSKIRERGEMRELSKIVRGFGTLKMIEIGTEMADDLVKGFTDGSIKGFNDAFIVIGNDISKQIKSIPIVGGITSAAGELVAKLVDSQAEGGLAGGGYMGMEDRQKESRISAAEKMREEAGKLRVEQANEEARMAEEKANLDQENLQREADAREIARDQVEWEEEWNDILKERTKLNELHISQAGEALSEAVTAYNALDDAQAKFEQSKSAIDSASTNDTIQTALGAMKVQGVGDKDEALKVAQDQLDEAKEQSDSLSRIADSMRIFTEGIDP